MIRIGVDTGGTFTDLVLLDGRELFVHKVRSTPDDPSRAILQGIAEVLGLRVGSGAVDPATQPGLDVVHGSTVATNAVLERRGARVGLLATRGFEDVLHVTARDCTSTLIGSQKPVAKCSLASSTGDLPRNAVSGILDTRGIKRFIV